MAGSCEKGNESFVPYNRGNFLKAEEPLACHDGIYSVVLIYESLFYIHSGSRQFVSLMQPTESTANKAHH
jgi:hypothetical protein